MRFQFYSALVIRIEYSPSGCFRDIPTAVVANRELGGAEVTVEEHCSEVIIDTGRLVVHYQPGTMGLSRDNLWVEWMDSSTRREWRPGDVDTLNLGGTLRSLDGFGAEKLYKVDPGVISRSKYFVLDDSTTPGHDTDGDSLWPQFEEGYVDIYFAVYDDFTQGLQAYAGLTGRVPMIPRRALGLWFSRYYPYSNYEFREIVRKFEKLKVPLDVLVMDVDWHLWGWEGFDWDTDLIPDPSDLLVWLHERGLLVGANVHPGGVPDQDSHSAKMRDALGWDSNTPVKLDLTDPDQAHAYMDVAHQPVMEQGIDFWWVDGDSAHMQGLDSQHATNHVYFTFTKQHSDARPMILSRFGGLGSHRYPIGFSGDTKSDWAALAYQVEFTSTAGNALMPYWSHDIGGFCGNRIDSQLYVRWVQFGALSPILRLHSDHGYRAPWDYGPEVYAAFKKAYDLRLSLIPYIYSLCRESHSDSMPLVRPMYYHWPEDEECYQRGSQFMLGPWLLACPVTYPASGGRAHVEVYLPDGIWFDYWTGHRIDGGRSILYPCPLDRTPLFVRAGAVIPTQNPMSKASACCPDPLVIHAYPGADGGFTIYEDDGETQDWERGEFTLCPVTMVREGDGVKVSVGPAEGQFIGWKRERNVIVQMHGAGESATQEKVIDLRDGAEFLFTETEVPPSSDIAEDFEVSLAMIQGTAQLPALLQLSAVHGIKNMQLSVDLPEGWSVNPHHISSSGLSMYTLQIPRHQPPGIYNISAQACISQDDILIQDSTNMEWAYASITQFNILGTFSNNCNSGMEIPYPPEADCGRSASYNGRVWKPINDTAVIGDVLPVRYIDLTRHFGPICDVVAYAMTWIHSEWPRDVSFDIGADDGIIAWLNGAVILSAPEPGPAAPGQFRASVHLRAGWNQVMLKIGQLFGDWGFYFEIRTPDGNPAEGLRISPTGTCEI
ncbi:MAG: TIM-barrel domain-containing protein [Armatimonadota bacterium]